MLQRRRSAGVTLIALVALVICSLAGEWLFISPVSPRNTFTQRAAEGSQQPPPRDLEPQLSPEDPYQMPRTAEEEKDMNFWKSDFDDLSAEEKLQSPLVVIGLFFLSLPFIAGTYFLVTGGGLDE
eukprot:symbB.v1.2.008139.t1/scaffold509.1/size193965/9